MNVLIVEDDETKRTDLQEFISSLLPSAQIELARSYQSAVRSLIAASPDLVLLDMTMPSYDVGKDEDGGRTQHYAGREVLRQVQRRAISTKVVVVTGFDTFGEGEERLTRPELDKQLSKEHGGTYLGTVHYSAAAEQWKVDLKAMLKRNGIKHA